jgi:hypothetical protein
LHVHGAHGYSLIPDGRIGGFQDDYGFANSKFILHSSEFQ